VKIILPSLGRFALTGIAVAAAGVVAVHLWDYYVDAPWTRDGRVRADIVQVAPDVSGLVTAPWSATTSRSIAVTSSSASTAPDSRLPCSRPTPWSRAAALRSIRPTAT
jgi:hypothetical protein